MQPLERVTFGQFRLDVRSERLWKGSQVIPLRPKAFSVLTYLLAHPQQLVTKQELLEAVWPGTFVTDAVLKDSVRQLREALDDRPAAPQYIETAHRRGYRFIGKVSSEGRDPVSQENPAGVGPVVDSGSDVDLQSLSPSTVGVLGRETEFNKLRGRLDRAFRGERQIVFVTGEAGIGKTTLVNALLEQAAAARGVWIARGQCLEHYGSGEAYLPVLDAFSRLGRTQAGGRVIDLLRQHAPAWLHELPTLVPPAERQTLQQQGVGATRERMLREMAEAAEAITKERPLILVLEDLHWSDYSTLDLIAYLARRRDPARLLVIGTYRPVDVILGDHPLKAVKRELHAHGFCQELPLESLTEAAIGEYLAVKFPHHHLPSKLARFIHRRTEGNPLFMVNVVQYLIDEHVIVEGQRSWQLRGALEEVESGVPENIRQLIERQIERLSPDERKILEGASVVGMECSAVAIAAGLDEELEHVEERCEALVQRHQFLSPARLVELPDGTLTPRYKFSHVLYLEVPYSLVPPMRRAQIHGRIGERGEAIYRVRVGEIAAELAMHFEQARDPRRAVKYLLQAAETAAHRSAHHESATLARRGLLALEALPETPDRAHQELALRMMLGVSLMATGFAAAEVQDVCRSALELCAEQGASRQAFMFKWLLGLSHYFRAELPRALDTAQQLVDLADSLGDPVSIIEAHRAYGVMLVETGRFSEALPQFDEVTARYDAHGYDVHRSFAGHDPKVVSDCFGARALWALGHPDQALDRCQRALSLAQTLAHVPTVVIAAFFAAQIHQLRGESAIARDRAETAIALADEYGLELWSALAHNVRAWARVQHGEVDDGIEELRRGLAACDEMGTRLWRAQFLGALAESLAGNSQVEEGLRVAAEALALFHETREGSSAAELYRIHGLLLTMTGDAERAERSFTQALSVARQQQAKSWELKTILSLGHLYRTQGKHTQARKLVKATYDRFREAYDTADLKAARAFLDEPARTAGM